MLNPRKHQSIARKTKACLLAVALFACGCKHKANGSDDKSSASRQTAGAPAFVKRPPQFAPLKNGSGSAHVNYLPNVHVVEREAGIKAIKGISSGGQSLLLDASDPSLASLKADDVLVIKGYIARKVLAAEVQGPNILVITKNADLTDAVEDGRITLAAPIRFSAAHADDTPPSMLNDFLDRLTPPVYAQSTADDLRQAVKDKASDAVGNMILNGVHGKVISGWTTDFFMTPADDHVDVHLKLTKSVAGFVATITGEGNVSNFDMDTDLGVEHSKYEQINLGIKNLTGMMNFNWQVATDAPGHAGNDRMKLPAAIEIPLYEYLDGLPLYLDISSALILKPALNGGKEYSTGAFRVSFAGYQHFSANKGNIDSDGNVTGDIQLIESQNVSAVAPTAMVVAFAAPRIELSFGLSKIIPTDNLDTAAKKVDEIADLLAKKALTPDQYEKYTNTVGTDGISKVVKDAIGSNAAAYFEMQSSAGMSYTGSSAIVPCTRHDIHLWGHVGVTTKLPGISEAQATKQIYKKDFSNVSPPGVKLCENIGT
jgi:hypothetical protein